MSVAGGRLDPETIFLSALARYAQQGSGALRRKLAAELDGTGKARQRVIPKRQAVVAQLTGCLSRGPDSTAAMRGAIADLAPTLRWERPPVPPELGDFARRTAYCTIVGPDASVPSDRVLAGLMLVGATTHYPVHDHAADEVYLPLSGPIKFGLDGQPSRTRAPGRFIEIPSWTRHEIQTTDRSVLLVWAWLGDVKGPYRIGRALLD